MNWLRALVPPPLVLVLGGAWAVLLQNPTSPVVPEKQSIAEKHTEQAAIIETNTADVSAFARLEAGEYSTQLASVAERPLFSETRRIPEPAPVEDFVEEPMVVDVEESPEPVEEIVAPVEEPLPPPEPPRLSYRGFMQSGDQMSALIFLSDTGEESWVSPGDLVSDWSVAQISDTAIQLRHGDNQHIVEINQ